MALPSDKLTEMTDGKIFPNNDREQIVMLATSLSSRIDFDYILQASQISNDFPAFGDVLEILDRGNGLVAISDQDSSNEFFGEWKLALEKLEKVCEKHGILIDTPETIDVNLPDVSRDREIIIQANHTFAQITEFNDLVKTYAVGDKGGLPRIINTVEYRNTLLAMRYLTPDNILSERLIRNPKALKALTHSYVIERAVLEKKGITLLPSQTEQGFPPEYKELPFPVEGLQELKDGYIPIITNEVIRQLLLGNIYTMNGLPPCLLAMIDKVYFTDTNSGDSREYINSYPDDQKEDALSDLQENVMHVLVHEIFERVALTLNLGEMRDYESAVERDKSIGTEILTTYVRRTRYKHSNTNYADRVVRKEDFCEAAAMFATYPHRLYIGAPNRYAYMMEFFAQRLHPQLVNILHAKNREIIEAMTDGQDTAMMRASLQSHQNEPEDKYTDNSRWVRQGRLEIVEENHDITSTNSKDLRKYHIPITVDLYVPQ